MFKGWKKIKRKELEEILAKCYSVETDLNNKTDEMSKELSKYHELEENLKNKIDNLSEELSKYHELENILKCDYKNLLNGIKAYEKIRDEKLTFFYHPSRCKNDDECYEAHVEFDMGNHYLNYQEFSAVYSSIDKIGRKRTRNIYINLNDFGKRWWLK